MTAPVVVSGLGVVMAGAWGWEEAAALAASGRAQPSEVDRSAGYHRGGGSRRALLVDPSRVKDWLRPMESRRMSPASRFAVCASLMACEDAGVGEVAGDRTAVVMATTYGAAWVTERILRQILLEGPEAASPALFTESVANAPAAQVALRLGATGANSTVTQRQSGIVAALAQAVAMVGRGVVDRVLVGAVDEMSPLLHAILDRFGALALPGDDDAEVGRPFDRNATGWLAAEGAVVALVERAEDVRRRGGRVRASVLGARSAFDPEAPRSGWGTAPGSRSASLRAFLRQAGETPAGIDRIVCSAGGLPEADRLEGRLLREVWDPAEPAPVFAPCALFGNHGGSLLLGSVLAATGADFGPTPGFVEVDPEAGIWPHDGRPMAAPRRVLTTACSPGGSVGWALFGRTNG